MTRPKWINKSCILLMVVFVLLPVSPVSEGANSFTIPESKLLGSEFSNKSWGPASVIRTDAPGDAVKFAFSGLATSSTALKDDYPVDTVYGQKLPSHGNGDFSGFSGYVLWAKNLDDGPVSMSLFINTGFTGPSGVPSNDPRNDTFWQSPWTELSSQEARVLTLQFDNAIPWNIEDNPEPHSHGTNGVATVINTYDRTELSAIGFQVFASSNPQVAVLVKPIPEPVTLTLLGAGFTGMLLCPARRLRK